MKIAITGTRGIPNQYGGFEQFAEHLSAGLTQKGHEVWMYNAHFHPFHEDSLGEVRIVRRWSPERLIGSGANYLYDFLCLKDAIKHKPDIILECGYASAAPTYPRLKTSKTKLVTHMDGMEWQRSKWSPVVRAWIRRSEKKVVRFSDAIICDHPVIVKYYQENHAITPEYIAYGADVLDAPDTKVPDQYGLEPGGYYITVARLEPENNILMVIGGYRASGMDLPLVIIGDRNTKYARKLQAACSGSRDIIFLGGLYNEVLTQNLRHFSKGLFHGHSVGGTNPSLLEAMAAGANIIAHDNPYNRHILSENARFFTSSADIRDILLQPADLDELARHRDQNLQKIRTEYQWETVVNRYEELFIRLAGKSL